MVSIIKNQLLKHLSRYTKNLSPDKVNLSTFRGEGELSNLQLDEEVLTDLLELPSWLRLTSAWCNHVTFRIHWTKLKSTPITLNLDEVNITVETCEVARSGSATPAGGVQSLSMPMGKYSFIHKVIDGITIVVNTVNVNFKSPAFTASVQMSRIRVESRTPKWLLGDLRVTRLKDPTRGLILIFKEMSWQTVRIEASSTQDKKLTPLRLLTNQARCRITIKKKLSDCSVQACRLVLILDDLLWVLTDSQLKAALHFVDSLWGLIQTSTKATQRSKAQKKLETLPEYQAQMAQSSRQHEHNINATVNAGQLSAAQKSFNAFDVHETSYHFFSQRIDLHFCDDDGDGRSSYPDLKNGGALQISVHGFQVDYYPYHLAKANRAYWPKYKEGNIPPALWLEQSLNAFKETILNISHPNRTPAHAPLERTPNMHQQQTPSAPSTPSSSTSQTSSPIKRHILDNLAKLMCSCVILRVEDFTIFRVTTSGKKQMPKEFISGDKDRYSFPPDMSTLHAEFTYFYYPGDFTFPLPPSKVFIHVNPVQINFDIDSCLWLSSFALNLHESLLRTSVGDNLSSTASSPSSDSAEPSLMYMDVKMEAIMPRIIFESSIDAPQQRDRPKSMNVQISRFAITNIREMGASRADLAQALHSLQEGSLVFASGFPSKEGDMCIVTDRILSHVAATDNFTPPNSPQSITSTNINTLPRYLLWSEPRDVWCVKVDPIWIDFYGARSIGQTRPVPFLDAVPITLWLHGKTIDNAKITSELYNLDFNKSVDPKAFNLFDENKRLEKMKENLTESDSASLILSVNSLKKSLEYNSNSVNLLESFTNVQYKTRNPNLVDNNLDSYNASVDLDSEPLPHQAKQKEIPATAGEDESKTADLHVIAHVSNLVSVQIDHYQYLFLMRLAEELTELSTFLSLDSKRIMKEKYIDKSIIIGCVVPQVEVSLVMPSTTPGKESNNGDGESVVLPDSASLGDDLHLSTATTSMGWPLPTPPANTSASATKNTTSFPFGGTSVESPIKVDESDFPHPVSQPNTHGHNVHIQGSSTPSKSVITRTPSQQSTPPPDMSHRNRSNRNSTVDVALPSTFTKDINSGLSSMKKGFSSFMTSIDVAMKTVNPSDDASDTISIRSDLSSDSENFIMVLADEKTADCMDVMFRLNPFANESNLKVAPVEVASEVCEDPMLTAMSSPSEPSEGSSFRRRDLVSMVTFRLTTVELIRQNKGAQSTARVQVAAITCDECGAIPWDEFQALQEKKTKFGARCRAWNVAPYNPESPPCVGIRFEEDLDIPYDISNIIDKREVLNWFVRDLKVKVKNLNMQMSMSTVIGLGDLAEDEILPQAIPMDVDVENVCINLIEDRPPINITSPGPVPINLAIGKMRITRDESGLFHIQPIEKPTQATTMASDAAITVQKSERDKELLSLQLVMQQLKMDNENLRKKLNISEKNTDSHKNRSKQEIDVLKTYLKAAQDDISTLLDEKRTLMDTIKSLQLQLTSNSDSFGRNDKR